MKSWILKEYTRKEFRVAIDFVISRMEKRTDIADIVRLCSAIESLDELKPASSAIDPEDLKYVIAGAVSAAKERGLLQIEDRVRGILKLLEHQSLPSKLKQLGKAVRRFINRSEFDIVLKHTLKLRTISAHGGLPPASTLPTVGPTVEALVCVMVIYDLTTNGMCKGEDAHTKLNAIGQAKWSISYLRKLASLD
ncbi:hypothetical protein METY_0125 [Methylopila sp. Yamaguchi]|nr:hypothetical protein METY_0125 [Methylopila sp. Yamaguchi]